MKNINAMFSVAFAMLLSAPAIAQHRCFSTEYMQHKIEQDASILQRMEAIEEHTNNYIAQLAQQRASSIVYTIPVVFHVVYNGASENVPDNVIISQLDVLNEDFRKMNADASTVVPAFMGIHADTEIDFCLASVDPSGSPTSGITRTPTSNSSFSFFSDNVKFSSSGGINAWPRDEYLNIWVCDIGSGILGYAQFPGGPANTDGVVIDYAYTGRTPWASGPLSPYQLGRTATHEVGHWLNLRHIWGDGGCGVDDGVSDTPASDGSHFGCPTSDVSCGSLDNVQNYMDYSDDPCLVMFTAGQKSRMQATMAPGGPRASVAANSSVVCSGAATCDATNAPSGLSSTSSGALSWTPIANSVACEISGGPVGGGTGVIRLFGTSLSSYTVPSGVLSGATTYGWRVRCACTVPPGPIDATPFSAMDFFTTPAPREGQLGNEFSLFPNPAEDRISLDLFIPETDEVEISVVDLMGRVLRRENQSMTSTNERVELDLQGLANGTYFVQVLSRGERMVETFSIAR